MSLTQVQGGAVAQNPVIGVPGQVFDSEPHTIVSKTAAEDCPFGVFVGFTAEDSAELPDAAGEVTGISGGGITVWDKNKATGDGYKQGEIMSVLTRGKVYVLAEETVVITDTPFTRHTAGGGGSQKGAFRNDADTATASTPAGSKFFRGGGTSSPPVLELF